MPEENGAGREELDRVIRQWNRSRLDLFEISPPDQNLEFHGVMRFYLEDASGENVATKCLRVSSVWTTVNLLDRLSQKIGPDLETLSGALWLWEVQAGKERRLEPEERPLVVQLNWNKNNREGRFVLKSDKDRGEKENVGDKGGMMQNFRRTLSKKDKKKLKNRSTENSSRSETKRDPPCLPIAVEFTQNTEDSLLCAVINYTNSSTVHFKLSPAFVLYAAARSLLCPEPGSRGQRSRVSALTDKMVERMRKVTQRRPSSAGALCFWMSNCCELLHFLKRDAELQPITEQSQRGLSRLLRHAYRSLIECLQAELMKHLPTFLLDPQTHGALPKGIELVLNTLMTSMSLLRRCKVHPALSIQLFSQLFHYVSAWLFNRLLAPRPDPAALRSHHWGATLRLRLSPVEAWAERQGLELAADCHLGLITQATALLTLDPSVEVQKAQSCCFRLSPAQIQALLQDHSSGPHQRDIPREWIAGLVSAAKASSDLSPDHPLEESLTLQLPLLLPEQGYCSQTLRGVPPGLTEFMEPVCKRGLCSLTPPPLASGDWTVHFSDTAPSSETTYLEPHRDPEEQTVTLHKPLNSGMGLSIVAAKGAGQSELGIYIKSIVRGCPAEMNGRLSCGDQLLSVDGQSLVGRSQESAADALTQTGPVVTLQVAKYAAGFHGLEELLRDKTQDKQLAVNRVEVRPSRGSMHHSSSLAELSSSCRKQSKLQRNRQLYRSNPNILHLVLEEEEETYEPKLRQNKAANSSVDLSSSGHYSVPNAQREYLTLPNPKNKDTSEPDQRPTFTQSATRATEHQHHRRTFMRQASSHENLLCTGVQQRPLVDKRPEMQLLQRHPGHSSSFPLRQSLSTHDIQNAKTGPVIWNTAFSTGPLTSVQPIRIDIPLTRNAHSNPTLTTFQSLSQLKTSQKLHENSNLKLAKQAQEPVYDCPVKTTRGSKSCFGNDHVNGRKPQVNVTPTKHVSFQIDAKVKRGERNEAGTGQKTQLMEQEVQRLQAKAQRSSEENERLKKLSLEFEFQRRLKEMEERDNQEEEELDMMRTLHELEPRTQVKRNPGNATVAQKENQTASKISWKDDQGTTGEKHSGQDAKAANRNVEEKSKSLAPEKLSFRERQQLFSLTSSA